MENPIRQRLDAVRQAVLKVHKALIDSERDAYEQTVGRIQSCRAQRCFVEGEFRRGRAASWWVARVLWDNLA